MNIYTKLVGTMAMATGCLFSGCKSDGTDSDGLAGIKTNKSNTTYVVTVGMETSKFAGACPGAGLDARRMTELFRNYTDRVTAFSSETAIKKDVIKAISDGVANAELFIFYYSGHGGSDRFWDTGADEADGKDEYFCLYDTYLRDNEMWQLISKSKGRVLIMADMCHSQTCFMVPAKFDFRSCLPFSATHIISGTVNMQCWSGCPDDTYSYGSSTGGQFTNTFLKYFRPELSYDELWKKIESDQALQQFEKVQRTKMGNDFGTRDVLK